MKRPSLAQRIVELDRALAAIPHAFGGALALAYYAEPRATIDIDLNVFIPVERFPEVASPLVDLGASVDDDIGDLVRRDGQARVMWDETPIDLFFAYDAFHDAAAAARRTVPFADGSIPILAAEHLIVCKAVFNRAKDWVDIDAMLAAEPPLDVAEVMRWVARIAGDRDSRFERIAAVLAAR
ncbi:MAG: hypothetical protein QOI47_1019 [Actinomycetota bacterium]|nr:hypothetical protein [Actinomycetota bacterium]